jgi:GT2 family glycosyltransferase
MTSDPLTISVAILTWNRKEQVLRAIRSAFEQSYPPHEVVVVDSASTDGSAEAISREFPTVRIIRLHRNLGCPEGRNIALANCVGDVIFSLDDDGWLAPDTLEVCVRTFRSDERIGIVGCRIVPPEQAATETDGETAMTVTSKFSGGAAAHRRETFDSAGYYPADFFRQGEESDLALRVIESGYTIIQCPRAILYHARPKASAIPPKHFFYAARNSLFTITRQYPLLFVPPFAIYSILSWNILGMRTLSLHYTAWALVVWLGTLPRLLTQRRPVSSRTVRTVLALRARNRFSA